MIGRKYGILGVLLLEDNTAAITTDIIREKKHVAAEINSTILERWIEGTGRRPIEWNTFIDVLKQIGLHELAQKIKDSL